MKGLGLAALALAAAPPEPARLPAPSAMPLAVVADPLLAFGERVEAGGAFPAAVAAAVERSPAVAEAVAVAAETRGVRQEVRAALRPRVDVDVSGQQVITRDFADDPDNLIERSRPERREDAVITAEQLVFDFGAANNRLRAARAREAAARAQVALAAEDAATRAVSAWYDVYLARSQIDLGEALVARHRAILGDTRARVAQGVGAAGDVARVEAYLASAQARVARAGQALEAARLRYLEAYGVEAAGRLFRPVPPGDAGGFADALAAARAGPAAQVARLRIEAARRDLAAARDDRYPRVLAGIDAAKYSVFTDQVDHDVRARLTLRHRLYGGGSSAGRVAQAAARVAQTEFAEARIVEEGAREAGVAYRDVQSLGRQAAILRDAYVASRRTRDLYVEQFRVARGSLLELLRAESDLHDAATAYLRGVAEWDVARYTLLARTGALLPRLGIEVTTP